MDLYLWFQTTRNCMQAEDGGYEYAGLSWCRYVLMEEQVTETFLIREAPQSDISERLYSYYYGSVEYTKSPEHPLPASQVDRHPGSSHIPSGSSPPWRRVNFV
ncbi:hypothetical protein V6N13_004603 [Hibiscus sabdariffa]|uniref:Uncharacterized protein n=1 Tax=Hibiscus sabdariffa TaxID=183260 RepID=A0ABR2RZJ8_9ROSI